MSALRQHDGTFLARRRGTVRVGAALVVLGLLAGVGEVTRRDALPAARPGSAAVVGAAVVCPDVEGAEVVAGSTGAGGGALRVAAIPPAPTPTPPTPLPPTPPPPPPLSYDVLPVQDAGRAAFVGRRDGAVVVQAAGAVAAGLAVEQRSRDLQGPVRGTSAQRCGPTGTSAWFVGGATSVGDSAQLVLVNTDDAPALVDVQGWSATGPLERRAGRGIAVPPRGRTVVELDTVAPDRDLLALHVQGTRGRVAVALRHARADGRTAGGVDWVPVAGPPGVEVLVAGLARGPGSRTLVVTNPGPDATTVDLQLLTGDGAVDLDPLDVPAGTSVPRSLTRDLASTPATVRVRSQGGAVLAGAEVLDLQKGPVRELSWAGAATVLTGPALLADVALSPPAEVTLLLTATVTDAVAILTPLPVSGQPMPPVGRRVEVPALTTVPVRLSTLLPPGSTARLAVQLRTTGGPVVAARVLRERAVAGPLTAVLPVVSGPGRVRVPVVRPDQLAGR